MNRKELIDVLARCVDGLTKADAGRVYDGLVDLAKRQLSTDGEFMLPGLGALKAKTQKARTARNPQTGAPIQVPEKKTVRFSAYKELKETLNPPAPAWGAPAEAPAAAPSAPEPPAPNPAQPVGMQPEKPPSQM